MRRIWRPGLPRIIAAILCLCALQCHAEEAIKQELTLAFVPSRDTNQIQLSADRIAQALSLHTGYRIRAITVQNYAAIVLGMSNKTIDIAFVGPLDYVVAHEKNGSYPITASVRHGQKGYRGLIIAAANSDIRSLAELKGRTVALGDPLSASGNLYPRAALRAAGVGDHDYRVQNLSSASAIVMSVLSGKIDAGAIYNDARNNPEVLKKFPQALSDTRILAETQMIPADPQIVRVDLNHAQVQKLRQALLAISADTEERGWLKSLFSIDALSPANDTEYDSLRAIVQTSGSDLLKTKGSRR